MSKAVTKGRNSERGAAGSKFLIILAVLVLIGNAGFNFIPVAYNGESLKQDMQTAVVQGLAMPGKMSPVDMVKQRINTSIQSNNIPSNAWVEVKQVNNIVQARVFYVKEVPVLPFGIYNYHYQFDYTATPTGFLTKQ
ncbi:MAG: hypothetical protein JSS81_11755 [Acidobacteria bacterium]|nr:hypothetical protein [Acidobacteriota bacterium]